MRSQLAGWDSRVSGPGARPEWPGAMLAESAREGRAKTLEALSQVGHTLGIAAATAVNLLNPEALLLAATSPRSPSGCASRSRASLHTAARRRRLGLCGAGGSARGEAAVRGAVALSRRQALDDPAAGARSLAVVG